MLIDRWMPAWEVRERHETRIRAGREQVWGRVRALDFGRSPVVRALFALRSLPGMLTAAGRRKALEAREGGLLRAGFIVLEEAPGDELVLGVVGRFWRPGGGIVRVTPEELRAFERPGFAIGVWNFSLADGGDGDGVRLATETRVRCTDPASGRAFRRYWMLVGPFSGLIRMEMLKSIRRAAEADA
ncbi:hypothetical protein [Longimicrobium sp.]|uniref:hypothetical protein n=1 Tax=Longimicrobium sp. TaxID=2029185 RepID=UPI002D1877FB|nr:hypothetical protein [Longimicrobium sp.]HSU16833.1 hypothetical protein [Longimicrobium sp.]